MAQRRTLYYDGQTAIWRDPVHGLLRDSLDAAGRALADTPVIVLVPAEEILITRVALPPIRQSGRRLTAARFALEDRLAGRLEDLHFVLGSAGAGEDTPVAVVDRARMQQWCDVFEAAGLDVARIVPDALALPRPAPDHWQLARIEERVLVRTGPVDGFACTADLWPTLAHALDAPAGLDIHATSGDAIQAMQDDQAFAGSPEITPHTHANADALIGVLLDSAELTRHPINLRQHEFARVSEHHAWWRPWALTGALVATWLVLAIAGRAIETWQINQRSDAFEQQARTAFQNAFPRVQTINDIRSQAQEGIRALRGGDGASQLFVLLEAAAAVAGQTDALTLQSMQYRNGELDLSIRGENVRSVETLRSGFEQRPDVRLSVQSADASSAGVQIRATLTSANAEGA